MAAKTYEGASVPSSAPAPTLALAEIEGCAMLGAKPADDDLRRMLLEDQRPFVERLRRLIDDDALMDGRWTAHGGICWGMWDDSLANYAYNTYDTNDKDRPQAKKNLRTMWLLDYVEFFARASSRNHYGSFEAQVRPVCSRRSRAA